MADSGKGGGDERPMEWLRKGLGAEEVHEAGDRKRRQDREEAGRESQDVLAPEEQQAAARPQRGD